MILAYSVAPLGEVDLPESVQVMQRETLQCFYSERARAIDQENLKDEALHFYEVNRQLFAQTAILEFRFPTVLKDISELADHLAVMESPLAEQLQRLTGLAQLTVYLPSEPPTQPADRSGTEYLRAKSDAAKRRHSLVQELSTLHGVRDTHSDADRLHLLIGRDVVNKLKSDLVARHISVAGPFPPSSFAKLLS
jgi:hypothetical protein